MAGLINGLNALGTAAQNFGGEGAVLSIKSDLAQQAATLADQLAGKRESAGRQEAGQIAEAAQGRQQAFETAQQGRQFGQQTALQGQAQTFAGSQATQAQKAEMERELVKVNADPEVIKVLRAFGALPQRGTVSSSSAASQSAPSSSAVVMPTNDMTSRLLEKTLGLPMAGSDQAIRAAFAADVNADPKFKGTTVGQKGAEVERRLAVASGKIGSEEDLDAIAKAQARYDLSPLDQRARVASGGPDITGKVLRENPKYSETKYDAIKETQKAIAPGGNLFVPISAMETSLGHAAHFLDLANELGNYSGGNWANIIPNKIGAETGHLSIVNAMQQTAYAMAEEGNRIYAGNAGTESAINNWYKSFPVNGSLADQARAVKNFAQLMGDKFDSMAANVNKTFKDSGLPEAELLTPKGRATYQRLISIGPDGKPKESTTAPALPPGFRVIQ